MGAPPARSGIPIRRGAGADAPRRFWKALSSCCSSSTSPSRTRTWRCLRFRSSTAWWFASAFSCATETVRTLQTVQKTGDFTGAVLENVVHTPVDVSTTVGGGLVAPFSDEFRRFESTVKCGSLRRFQVASDTGTKCGSSCTFHNSEFSAS